eukprot:5653411-Amphidinium_carterae.1
MSDVYTGISLDHHVGQIPYDAIFPFSDWVTVTVTMTKLMYVAGSAIAQAKGEHEVHRRLQRCQRESQAVRELQTTLSQRGVHQSLEQITQAGALRGQL